MIRFLKRDEADRFSEEVLPSLSIGVCNSQPKTFTTPNCKFGVLWPDAQYHKPIPVPKDRLAFSWCQFFWKIDWVNTPSLIVFVYWTLNWVSNFSLLQHLHPHSSLSLGLLQKFEGVSINTQQEGGIANLFQLIVDNSPIDSHIYLEIALHIFVIVNALTMFMGKAEIPDYGYVTYYSCTNEIPLYGTAIPQLSKLRRVFVGITQSLHLILFFT